MNWDRIIPGFFVFRNYKSSYLKGDFSAGLTVGVMLIPQGMAYAMIAGLPPIYGLYASTVPLLVYALFGSSRQLAVGPVAMVSLLTAAGVGSFALAGSEEYIAMAIVLALMVGFIQWSLGLFRLGFLVNFLSHPVISGFTSAAALIIGISQLKHLMGVDLPRSQKVYNTLIQAFTEFDKINIPTFLLGVGGILLILSLKRLAKSIPGPLVLVAGSILAVWSLKLVGKGVKIVGEIPAGMPSLTIPAVDWDNLQILLPTALAISLVSFMESIAVAKAVQTRHRDYEINPDQELRALGLANIFGSLFQSFPTTGGFSRTAVNDQAGAKTGLASMISALLILLTLALLTPLFYYLPQAVLASIIMVAVMGLVDIKEAVHLWRTDRGDFSMLIATFIATLILGIEEGIGIGVILSLAMVIYRSTQPHVAELGKVPGSNFFRNVKRFSDLEQRPDILIVRFDSDLFFANINFFSETIDKLAAKKGDALDNIIIDSQSISHVDSSAIHAIEQMVVKFASRDVNIYFTGVKGPVRDIIRKSGLLQKIGEDRFFIGKQAAINYIDDQSANKRPREDLRKYTLQSNDP